MNLYKEPNKGNPWGISRPVYQFEKTGSANVGTEVGKMRKELKLLQDDILRLKDIVLKPWKVSKIKY